MNIKLVSQKRNNSFARRTVLVTGGLGFIGSHVALELFNNGFEPIILDDLSNSYIDVLAKLKSITSHDFIFIKGDISEQKKLLDVIKIYAISSCIHLAGFKVASESINDPISYYDNNLSASIKMFDVFLTHGLNKIIFSSSAAVYGNHNSSPIRENATLSPITPYGRIKLMLEQILQDIHYADKNFSVGMLRYFNPVGAHKSGLLPENPKSPPTNLFPILLKVGTKEKAFLEIFGNEYPTKDGTAIRDFIHVEDLAKAHVAAFNRILNKTHDIFNVNIGTGKGYSVLELVNTFIKATGQKIDYRFASNRSGDSAICFADPSYACRLLNWQAQRTIIDMCIDAYRSYTCMNAQRNLTNNASNIIQQNKAAQEQSNLISNRKASCE